MFEKLMKNDYSDELIRDAKKYIKQDRDSYNKIYEHIIDFCSKNKLIISDPDFLLDQREYWNSIKIFTTNPDTMSKNLLKELCEKFETEFILKIKDMDVLYAIDYNMREMCSFNLIKLYKKFTLYDFIDPVKHKGIYLMPPFIEIIELYTRLYNPTEYDNWPELLETISKLNPSIDKYFKKILSIKNNDQLSELFSTHFTGKNKLQSKEKKVYPEFMFIKKILLKYINDSDYITVNNTAYNIETDIEDDSVIEVISKHNIDNDYKILSKYMDKETNYGIVFSTKELYIPGELLASKYVIYILVPIGKDFKKIHIMNIYNNMNYELVNYYIKNGYKIADPITQMKFIYCSIWNSIIAQKVHGLNIEDFHNYLREKIKFLDFFRSKINIYDKKENYDGVYINIQTEKKISALSGVPYKSSYLCYEI